MGPGKEGSVACAAHGAHARKSESAGYISSPPGRGGACLPGCCMRPSITQAGGRRAAAQKARGCAGQARAAARKARKCAGFGACVGAGRGYGGVEGVRVQGCEKRADAWHPGRVWAQAESPGRAAARKARGTRARPAGRARARPAGRARPRALMRRAWRTSCRGSLRCAERRWRSTPRRTSGPCPQAWPRTGRRGYGRCPGVRPRRRHRCWLP